MATMTRPRKAGDGSRLKTNNQVVIGAQSVSHSGISAFDCFNRLLSLELSYPCLKSYDNQTSCSVLYTAPYAAVHSKSMHR